MNSKIFTRVLSAVMAFLMILGMFPVSAFATGTEGDVIDVPAKLTVSVVSKDGNTPIEGAKVYVPNVDGDPSTPDVVDPFITVKGEGEDAVPEVQISGVCVGEKYTLTVKHTDYVDEVVEVEIEEEDASAEIKMTSLVDVNIFVVDKEGSVVGATVTLGDEKEPRGTTEVADGKAKVTLKKLTPGEKYTVKVEEAGHQAEALEFTCDKKTVEEGVEVTLKNLYDVELTVLDNKGEPVKGAIVNVKDEDGNPVVYKDKDGNTVTYETNTEGKVTLKDLVEDKKYTASATCIGYKAGSSDTFICAKDLAVTVEMDRTDVKLTFKDDLGQDIKSVEFVIDETKYETGEDSSEIILTGLEYGKEYTPEINRFGYDEPLEENVKFTVDDATIQNGKIIELNRAAKNITVKVTSNGSALKDATVTVRDEEGNVVGEPYTTDDEGKVTLIGMRYRQIYKVRVTCEGYDPAEIDPYLQWTHGNQDPVPVVDLEKYTPVTITGTVTCEGNAVNDVNVILYKSEVIGGSADEAVAPTSFENGEFIFEGVEKELVGRIEVVDAGEADKYKEFKVSKEDLEFEKDNEFVISRNVYKITFQEAKGGEIKINNAKEEPDGKTWIKKVKYGDSVTVSITADKEAGSYTHSIYSFTDAGAEIKDASGETTYDYTIESVTDDHTLAVEFTEDTRIVAFYVDKDGKIQEKVDGIYKNITIKDLEKTDNEDGTFDLKYTVTENYRIAEVKVTEKKVEKTLTDFGDNNDQEFTAEKIKLDKGHRKYVITVKLDRFKVTVGELENGKIEVEDKDSTLNDSMVDYNRSAKLTITPDAGYYLAELTANGNKVEIDYNSTLPTALLTGVKKDQEIAAKFEKIQEVGDEEVVVTCDEGVYAQDPTYYLTEGKTVTVKAVADNVKISRIETGEFKSELVLDSDDKLDCVYLLDGNVVTKVGRTVETVVDMDKPEIVEITTEKETNNRGKITAIEVRIKAADKDGSGVSRVVYSSDPNANVLSSERKTMAYNAEGDYYYHSFKNTRDTFYFWVVDNVGHVSEDVETEPGKKEPPKKEIDSDTDVPEVVKYAVDQDSYRMFEYTYNSEDGSQVTENRRYPVAEGIKFTLMATDKSGIDDDSVMIVIGEGDQAFTKEMTRASRTAYTYEVTVMPADVTAKGVTGAQPVSVKLTDKSQNGNTDTIVLDDTVIPGQEEFIFEKDPPIITATTEMKSSNENENWHQRVKGEKNDVVFSVNITDYIYDGEYTKENLELISGLDANTIKVYNVREDGSKMEVYPEKKDSSVTVSVGTTQGEANLVTLSRTNDKNAIKVVETNLTIKAEGEYEKISSFDLRIEAQDNEGNKVELASDKYPELKFKIDGATPVVEKFDLKVDNNPDTVYPEEGKYEDKYDQEYSDQEAEQKNPDVLKTNYGYFFRKDAVIRVYASDVGSGVDQITFTRKSNESDGTRTSETKTAIKDNSDDEFYYADFVVPRNFKGQIYAYVTDLVENKSNTREPKDLLIAESQESHQATTHVTLEIEEREKEIYDAKNIRLFSMYEFVENEDGKLVKKVDEETGKPVGKYVNGIPVEVVVTDTYNGIQSAYYTVSKKVAATGSGKATGENVEILSGKVEFTGNSQSVKDKNGIEWTLERTDNLVTKAAATIMVTENANEITVAVSMRDMANNWSKEDIALSIDNTLPKIEFLHVEYNKKENKEGKVSKYIEATKKGESTHFIGAKNDEDKDEVTTLDIYGNSTLQFKIYERNLKVEDIVTTAKWHMATKEDAEDLSEKIEVFGPFVEGKKGEHKPLDEKTPYTDETYYIVELKNCIETEEDGGTYRTNVTVKDLFGNEAFKRRHFVIDMFAPKVNIAFDNNEVRNDKYYNADRTATITVTERNYDNEKGCEVEGTATLDGKTVDFPKISGWETDKTGTVHTAKVVFNSDADYNKFTVTYTDEAGQSGSSYAKDFVIDKTVPVVSINNIMDKSANNDVVAPSISYTDINLDLKNVELTLTGVINGTVDYKATKETVKHGEEVIYADFARTKAVDDVYTLYVHAIDKAGNVTTETISFSCNRFGSVFDLTSIKDMLNKFNQEERTIVVTETNVDALDLQKARVTLTKNATPIDLVAGKDFTIQVVGGEGTWHQYIYKIDSEWFKDDGTYTLYFYTVDAAGNVNENIDDSKEAQISFGIDKTKPIVTPIDLESDAQYNVESKAVTIEIKDNLLLQTVKIFLNDEEVTYIEDGDTYLFDIPMSNREYTVKVVAVDAAGNEETVIVEDFLVNTNFFIRWYYNTPLFIGSLVLIGALMGGLIWWFIVLLRRKKEAEEETAA